MDYFAELKRRKELLDARGTEYLYMVSDDEGIRLTKQGALEDDTRKRLREELKGMLVDAATEGLAIEELEIVLEDLTDEEQNRMRRVLGHSQTAEDALIVNGLRYIREGDQRILLDCVATIKMTKADVKRQFINVWHRIMPAPEHYNKLTFIDD